MYTTYFLRYISFLEEQETARQFRHEVRKQPTGKFGGDLYIPVTSGRIFGSCRSKLWDTIDNNDSSVSAKVILLLFNPKESFSDIYTAANF